MKEEFRLFGVRARASPCLRVIIGPQNNGAFADSEPIPKGSKLFPISKIAQH
jgi:hypothetical protein